MSFSFTDRTGDGVTTAFTFSFTGPDAGYIRESDIVVLVDGVDTTFTLTGLNSVDLDTTPADQALVRIMRVMPLGAPYTDFSRGNPFGKRNINNSFLQQLYSLHSLADGFREDDYYEKQNLNMGDNRIVNLADAVDPQDAITKSVYDAGIGTTATDRAAAEAAAAAAAISETNAGVSETNAGVSEVNSAASEAAALAAKVAAENAAAGVGLNVVLVNFAASPVTGAIGDLYICDTTGGAVTINMPQIISEPAAIQIQKATGDANSVFAHPFAGDNIDQSASDFEITAAGTVAFQADLTGGTNNWQSINLNSGVAADATVDLYVDGVDFTAGVTTALVMSKAYVKTLVQVSFDGLILHHSEFEVSGANITFDNPIPGGVASVQIKGFSTAEFGVPIDNGVTTAKIANGAVTEEKLAAGLELGGPSLGIRSVMRTNATTIFEDITIYEDATTFTPNFTTNTLTTPSTTYVDGAIVRLETTGTIPTGLAEATRYFVVGAVGATFSLSLTRGGVAEAFSDNGSGTLNIYTPVNAMTAGTITIEDTFTVTIPEGSEWSII